ncbi:NADPH:quinone reductase-like Zn-dependent oxidoreductase [Rhodopseudomonas julia]|uniref:NADPH:quinone reductase-like Zn-dependent oxidoreductase n=1 Tax=Rhodopseudomonas julia TaxID=200617 RepID=A0ABU0C5Q6_9BRAD|nr:zinc-binding alcohol dehydrogenase family protein [Rhodopseudomonas julia]MDQ0325848.1 NADPH:quinone reductase-like Zn-dependent oxidoreductase [Rhodopseudomonas julia]
MKAAIVQDPHHPPFFGEIDAPQPSAGDIRISVSAAALSHLVRSRASGRHYSTSGRVASVAGVDGVGRRDDGSRVYFVLPKAPNGSMAEKAVVAPAQCIVLPDELDDVTAAAIANPGMSSWAALTERARLKSGETVLVNGATGVSGRLAVQVAKYLGAGKIIATGRNARALQEVSALGADVTIPLVDDGDALERSFKPVFAEGVDVVLDYLWGQSAERLLIAAARAGADAVPIRYVEIGGASGQEITLPGAVLRSSAIELMGSGIGSIPLTRLIKAIEGVLYAAVPGGFKIATRPVPLSDVEQAWLDPTPGGRIVFITHPEASQERSTN